MSKLNSQELDQLRQDKLLLELVKHPAYQSVLKPYLEERRSKSYPDPTEIKDKEEFYHAAVNASMFKKVIAELLHYLEIEVPDRIKSLEAKKKGESKTFAIGR